MGMDRTTELRLAQAGHLRALQTEIHSIARSKGFHDTERTVGEGCMLIASEVAEAFEEWRRKDSKVYPAWKERFGEELADIVIRVMDEAELRGVDLASAILAKIDKNRERDYMHGGKAL